MSDDRRQPDPFGARDKAAPDPRGEAAGDDERELGAAGARRGGGQSLGFGGGDDGPFDLDDVDLRDVLRRAMRPPPGSVAPPLLRGVQRRLRARSGGKFYGDGWSNARAPRSTYLITSLVMLAVIALAVIALVPWSGAPAP